MLDGARPVFGALRPGNTGAKRGGRIGDTRCGNATDGFSGFATGGFAGDGICGFAMRGGGGSAPTARASDPRSRFGFDMTRRCSADRRGASARQGTTIVFVSVVPSG